MVNMEMHNAEIAEIPLHELICRQSEPTTIFITFSRMNIMFAKRVRNEIICKHNLNSQLAYHECLKVAPAMHTRCYSTFVRPMMCFKA